MYSLYNYTSNYNYQIIFLFFSWINLLSNLEFYILYRKEFLYSKTRHYHPIYNKYSLLTYLSDFNIDIYYSLLFINNILLILGIGYRFNLLLLYYHYVYIINLNIYHSSHLNILKYSTFIFLISPYIFNNLNEYIPSYGLFLLNYKIINVYFSAGISKINNSCWNKGNALRFIFSSLCCVTNKYIVPNIISEVLCFCTLFWEIIGWSLFLNPLYSIYGILIGSIFHLSLMICMPRLISFQFTMFFLLSSLIQYYDLPNSENKTNIIFNVAITIYLILVIINDNLCEFSVFKPYYLNKICNMLNMDCYLIFRLFNKKVTIIDSEIKCIIEDSNGYINEIIPNINKIFINDYWECFQGLHGYIKNQQLRNSFIQRYTNKDTKNLSIQINFYHLTDNINKLPNIYGNIYTLNTKYQNLMFVEENNLLLYSAINNKILNK